MQLISQQTTASLRLGVLRGSRILFSSPLVRHLPYTTCYGIPTNYSTESTGVLWALLLSPTNKVRRTDGSRVPISEDITWKEEFVALWKHIQRRKVRYWAMNCKRKRLTHFTDLARLHPGFLFFLLRRYNGHLPVIAFLRSRASVVIATRPYVSHIET